MLSLSCLLMVALFWEIIAHLVSTIGFYFDAVIIQNILDNVHRRNSVNKEQLLLFQPENINNLSTFFSWVQHLGNTL